MAGTTENPRVWLEGDVYVANTTATAPTAIGDDLENLGFEALGLLSEDGLTESQDNDVTDHRAWGGILYRTTRTKHKRTFTVTCLEDNALVFDLVNPGSSWSSSGGTTTRTVNVPSEPNPKSFIFKTVDGDYTSLLYVATGEVTDVGEVPRNENDPTMYELTITVYPDSDGVLYTDITDNPAADDGS